MSKKLVTSFCTVLCATTFITKVDAADYAAGFTVDTEASHNDNVRFVQNDKTAVNKYDLSPKFTLGANTETDKFQLDSNFDFNRFDKSEFNSDDQNLSLTLSHSFENSSLGLNATYIHNSTLTSESLTSGRIGTSADRAEQYILSPNWTYSLNETNSIQLIGSYTEQNYGNAAYTGYKNASGEFDWIHIVNERLKLIASASYADYRSDSTPFNLATAINIEVPGGTITGNFLLPNGQPFTQNYSSQTKTKDYELGADYQFTEQSLLSARFGRSRNDFTYSVKDTFGACATLTAQSVDPAVVGAVCNRIPDNSKDSTTTQVNWTWGNERQQFSLNATKQTQPTSNGYTVDALQIGSNWSYQFSELDKISANISAVRNRSIDKTNVQLNASIADRNYESVLLQYQRQLTEYWFVNAGYEFSEQKYTQVDYHANSKVVSIGITYQPAQWHWSR